MLDWYCEKGECRMTKATCIARRKKARNLSGTNMQGNRIRFYGCLTCPQFEDKDMEEEIAQQTPEEPKKECIKCHEMKHAKHDFRINYRHPNKHINICKACEVQMPKVKPPKKEQPEHKFDGVDFRKIDENSLLIDFTNYPDLLSHIKGTAYLNFRTTEQQMLFLIQKDMMP